MVYCKKSLCLFYLVLFMTFLASSVFASMPSPLRVELNISQFPKVNQEAVLDCTLESRFAVKNVSLTIDLPEGVELINGSKTWQGDMAEFQIMPLQLKIKVTSPGNKTITATVFCRVNEQTAYSDVAQVFFHSQAEFAVVGHVTEFVPTMSAAASLETGEIAEPIRLDDYTRLQLQVPYNLEPCSVGPGDPQIQDSGPTPPGTVTVSGKWYYYARDDTYTPMNWVYVELRHGVTDVVLTSAWVTDNDGRYTFPAVTNPGADGFRVRAWCFHNNSHSSDGKALRVVGEGAGRDDGGNVYSICYSVQTGVRTSVDGTYDMGTWHVVNGSTNEPAWWIMMDLNQGFWWPYWWNDHTTMNGGVTVEWSSTSTTGDFNYRTDYGGNICLKAASPNVCDVVLHEYGHEVQWDGYDQWLPSSDCPSPHYFELEGGPHCAWYEGFANWYKFAVTNDPVYHWAGGGSLNIEIPTWGSAGWDNGDLVEGRVAGAMWDFGDSNADGYDTCELSWEYIWDTWYGSANRDNTFAEFWTRWKNKGQPKHHAIKALYQNTIDYNTWPTFSGLPNVYTNEDTDINNAFDLYDYASDPESYDYELEYQITENTDPDCGVSIDSWDYVDVNPTANWYGTSTVTISCRDGIRTRTDSFVVTVYSINDPPIMAGLPDRIVTKNTPWNNTIDLYDYSSDIETSYSNLVYTITGNTNPSCGVSIDAYDYVDINPAADWTGNSYVTIRVTDQSGAWAEDTFEIVVANLCSTCSAAREIPDNDWVRVSLKTVTAQFADHFYMQDDGSNTGEGTRASGIKVTYANPPPVNTIVQVAGQMSSYYAERQINGHILITYGADSTPPRPLGMINSALGGASPNVYTRAVPEGRPAGLYNVGLLARTTGKVVSRSSSVFWIDDGSKATYSPSLSALYVDNSATGEPLPPLGARVALTGISSATTLSGNAFSKFKLRTADDIMGCGGRAAYIYDTDATTADQFVSFLGAQRWITSKVLLSKLTGANLSRYDVIIIGGDTSWTAPANVAKVVDSGKPVIGVGAGGAYFLDQVHDPELNIGWGPSAGGTTSNGYVVDTGLELFYFDNRVSGTTLTISSTAGSVVEVYNPPTSVIKLLRDVQYTSYWTVAQEDRFMQWGYYAQPSNLTTTGKNLFVNCLYYMQGK